MDLASLGIRVQTQGVKEADQQLQHLGTTGEKVAQQTGKVAPQMQKAALSAKELQFATRQLPMQFTDIATSLASGQRPLQVLLQQGGQLKDVFGGVGPALRAMGGYVAGLVNPLTLAIGAVAGLGLAWKSAQDEAQAFNLALIQTGNYAGTTAEDLGRLAEKLDETTEATAGFASDVLAQVVATGRFTGQSVETVSTAITNMAQATKAAGGDADEAIKSLVKSFTDLSKDPVEALLKLNETQHFLTQSTLDQVRSLVEQGKEAEAVEVAINALADTTNTRAKQMEGSLNSVNAVWRDMKGAIGEAWDETVGFFRDADQKMQEFLRNNERAVRIAAGFTRTFNPFAPNIADSLIDNAKQTPEPIMIGFKQDIDSNRARRKIKEEEEEERRAASFKDQYLTREENKKKAIAELDRLRSHYTKEEYEILKKGIEERFKPPKGRKPPKVNTRGIENASDRFDDMVGSFRSELEGPLQRAEQDHLKRVREIEQAARDGKRSHEDLAGALRLEAEAYAQTRTEIEQRIDAEVAGLSGPIAAAQADHEQALRRIEELKKTGRVTGDEYNAMLAEEAKRFDEAATAAARAADPIGALLSDMRSQLDLIGKTNAEQVMSNALLSEGIDLSSAYAQAKLAEARAIEEQGVAMQRSIDLMDEFRGGAADALTDFVTGAKSAKEAFADFFDDLAKRITQMIAEKWIEKAFGAFGTSQTGSSGGWISAILGMFAGGGSSNSMLTTSAFAKGGAFANGVQAFASGGVVDSPTLFPMRARMGLMGEAGPEAILPLKRTPSGALGVQVASNSQRPVIHNNTTFYVPDLSSRRNQQQVADRTQRLQSRATARN